MTLAPHAVPILVRRALVVAASIVVLAGFASAAGAAGYGAYSLEAQALLSSSATDLVLRVDGPVRPTTLEKVQVKVWRSGADGAETRNFFDVASPAGVATLRLAGLARGDALELSAHVKDGAQHNVEAGAIVRRRADLTVTQIAFPDDVVRTRKFDVTATVAETGGDVGADARVALFDGPSTTPLVSSEIAVGAGGAAAPTFRVALAKPGAHTLRAVVIGSA